VACHEIDFCMQKDTPLLATGSFIFRLRNAESFILNFKAMP